LNLTNLSLYSVILPSLAALFAYHKSNNAAKLFMWYIWGSLVTEIIAVVFMKLINNNMLIYHVYLLFEFIILVIYYKNIIKTKAIKWLAPSIIIGYVLYFLAQTNYADLFNMYRRSLITMEHLVFTFLGLYYFYHVMNQESPEKDLLNDLHFWLNCGVLLYFMGNAFIFMVYNQETRSVKLDWVGNIWALHSILNIFSNCIYTFGLLWCIRKRA
jgi:uncharacterized membrane protein YfcA